VKHPSRWTRSRFLMILGVGAYVFTFSTLYIYVLEPLWAYLGFAFEPSSREYLVAGFILALAPALWMPVALERPSQFVYWILYVVVVIPAALIPDWVHTADPPGMLLFQIALVGWFISLGFVHRLPLLRMPHVRVGRSIFWLAFIILSAATTLVIVRTFELRLVSLEEVYSLRSGYREKLALEGNYLAYLVAWQGNVFNPFLLALGLIRKKLVPFCLGFVGQVLIYSVTGFKSVVFAVLLLVLVLVATRDGGRRFGVKITWGLVLMLATAGAVHLWLGFPIPLALLGARTLGMPGLLTAHYYDFFSTHPFAFLADSAFKPFLIYPYGSSIPNLIGELYFGNHETFANAHLWADAYANFGYVGLVVFSALLAFTFLVADSVAKRHDLRFAILLFGIPAFSLANSAFLTCLVSHGILLALLLLYFAPSFGPTAMPADYHALASDVVAIKRRSVFSAIWTGR